MGYGGLAWVALEILLSGAALLKLACEAKKFY